MNRLPACRADARRRGSPRSIRARLLCGLLLFQLGLPLFAAPAPADQPTLVMCTAAGLVVMRTSTGPAQEDAIATPTWCPACVCADHLAAALPATELVLVLAMPPRPPRPGAGPGIAPRAEAGAGNRDPPAPASPQRRFRPARSDLLAS